MWFPRAMYSSGTAMWVPVANAVMAAGLLFEKYIAEYGTILCPHIQTQLYGRPFYLLDEQEQQKFEKAGGHGEGVGKK